MLKEVLSAMMIGVGLGTVTSDRSPLVMLVGVIVFLAGMDWRYER